MACTTNPNPPHIPMGYNPKCGCIVCENNLASGWDPKWPHGHLVDGYPAKVVHTSPSGHHLVVVDHGTNQDAAWYYPNGTSFLKSRPGDVTYGPIVNAPSPRKLLVVERVFNIYKDGMIKGHLTQSKADIEKSLRRSGGYSNPVVAQVPLKWEGMVDV